MSETGDKVDYVLVEVPRRTLERNGRPVDQEIRLPQLKFPVVADDGTVHYEVMDDVFPIGRVEKTLISKKKRKDEFSIKEYAFPLSLAYSLTVHKAQGATNRCAIVDIPEVKLPKTAAARARAHVKNGQMAYVALSRVTAQKGLCLNRKVTVDDLNAFAYCADKELIETEIARLSTKQDALLVELHLKEQDDLARKDVDEENGLAPDL